MRRSPVYRWIWGARDRASRLWHHEGGSSLVEWAALSAGIAALMVAVMIALRAQGTAVGTSIGQVIQCHITAAGSGGSCGNAQIGRSIPGVVLADMSAVSTAAVGLPLALAALPIAPSAGFLLGIAGLLAAGGLPISMIALSNAMNRHSRRQARTILGAGRVAPGAEIPKTISFNRSYLSNTFAMQTLGNVDQTVQDAQNELRQLEADVTRYLTNTALSAVQKRDAIIDSIQTRLTTIRGYLDTLVLEALQADRLDAAAGMMLINMEVVHTLGRIIAAVDGQTGSDGAPVADRNNAATDPFYTALRNQYQTIMNPQQQDIYYVFAPADHPATYSGAVPPWGYPNTPYSQIGHSLLAQNMSPDQLLYFGASSSDLYGSDPQWSDELVAFMGTLAFLNPAAQFVLAGHSSSGRGVADAALKHLNAQTVEQNRIRELLLFDPHVVDPTSTSYPAFGTGIVDQAGYQLDANTPPEVLLAQNMEISVFGSQQFYGTTLSNGTALPSSEWQHVYPADIWGKPTRLNTQEGVDAHRGIVSGMPPEAVETVAADTLAQETPLPITPIPSTPMAGTTPSPVGPTPAQPGTVTPDATAPPSTGTPAPVLYEATVADHPDIDANEGLTLRDAAGARDEDSVIALLAIDTRVGVLEIDGGWLRVRVLNGPNAGQEGWVRYTAEQPYLDGLPF